MSVEMVKGSTAARVLHREPGAAVQQAGESRGEQIPAAQTGKSSPASDTLNLTKKAEELQSVEAALADISTVDLPRVDAVRQRIEAGLYEINPGRLADKLIQFEQMRNGSRE